MMSMYGSHSDDRVLPIDAEIGDDGDQPGISQPVSQAEIDDVLNDTSLSAAERQARLEDLRERLIEREGADYGGEFTPLETRVMDALSMLAEGGHDYGSLESVGMEPDSRSDARSPDDDRNDEPL